MAAAGTRPHRLLRWAGRLLALLILLALTLALGFTLYAVSALPPLQPWHTTLLREEFRAEAQPQLDFAGYQQLEARLFAELQALTEQWAREGAGEECSALEAALAAECAAQGRESFRNSRFNPGG